jgi:phosphotransferase system HPr-like phosphotransfer protein
MNAKMRAREALSKMTSLGARQGHQLKLKAQGPDAQDAVREIQLLFETSFGEE